MPTAAKRYRPHGQSSASQGDHAHNSYQRGYTKRWAAAAKQFIQEQVAIDPRCRMCNRVPMSNSNRRPYDVDHIVPPSSMGTVGSQAYLRAFWDVSNWQITCISCNASKQDRIEP